jgi:hypothetical protein
MDLEIELEFKKNKYSLKGKVIKDELFVHINFQHPENDQPCINITYDKIKDEFLIGTINSKSRCLNPQLPEKGSLEILMMIALALIKMICGKNSKVYLSDMAMKDNIPLTILKIMEYDNPSTAYSKFGFRLFSPNEDDNFDSFIEKYKKDLERKMPKKEFDRLNIPYIRTTYKNFIRSLMEVSKEEDYTHFQWENFLNFEDIYTIFFHQWYLNWSYYNKISEKVKIGRVILFSSRL